MTQRRTIAVTETFAYEFENRLVAYVNPSPKATASYVYNGEGKRVSKTVNGTTTKYYYDGDVVILEKTGANSIYYIHGPKLDEIITDSRGYSYHSDGLGSVANLTDSAGSSVTAYTYKAFGSIRSQSGSVANSWLYTGRQLDSESGLYYYRNRYYDARVGRFITQDPSLTLNPNSRIMPYLLLRHAKSPLELQRYLYCINNPTNLVDPFGLNPWSNLGNWINNAWQTFNEWRGAAFPPGVPTGLAPQVDFFVQVANNMLDVIDYAINEIGNALHGGNSQ